MTKKIKSKQFRQIKSDSIVDKKSPEKIPVENNFKNKHLLFSLLFFLILNLFFLPKNETIIEHTFKNPADPVNREDMFKKMNQFNTPVVLMGNSILDKGLHPDYFMSLTKVPTFLIGVGATASAWWYLVLKNVICELPKKPKIVVIFFRDNDLTKPSFRTDGEYKKRIDLVSLTSEPILDKKAYLADVNPFEYFLLENWPLYQKKNKIESKIKQGLKDKISNLFFHYPKGEADSSIIRVFENKNMNKDLLSMYEFKAEQSEDISEFDFNKLVEKSFIPDYISIAKQNDMQLIFIRTKNRRDILPNSEPQELVRYIEDFKKYLGLNHIKIIDFAHDNRLSFEHYDDGDHLNQEIGKKTFTEMTAEALKPYINEFKADSLFAEPKK